MNETQLARAFAVAMAQAFKEAGLVAPGTKAPANSTAATVWLHGPGGIFGSSAIENQVISGRITPRGISGMLKALPSVDTNPLFPYVTGVEEAGDDEPSTECATCPSGVTESCWQTAPFGFVCRETQTLTPNRAIERINSGEVDLELVNDILGGSTDAFRAVRNYNKRTVMQIATAWAMIEVAILMQNKLIPMIWQGNPANNVGTGYKEFPGLDILVSQNKVDAETGTACEALYSDVKDFNYQNINTSDAQGNFNIVRQLRYMEAYLFHNADRMGMMPVKWCYAMRPELWYELTEIWPVAYWSTRNIVLGGGRQLNIDAERVQTAIDGMRDGLYIYINGRKHDVVLDDGIFESDSANDANVPAGSFASSIYQIPITYMGRRDATFLQYKDYTKTTTELRTARMLNDEIWHSSDGGRFLWTRERVKWCYTLSGKIEPRIVLKTPMLAGRLDHVLYTPEQHFRSPWEDSDYFFKGGVEERPAPSFWSDWNLPD